MGRLLGMGRRVRRRAVRGMDGRRRLPVLRCMRVLRLRVVRRFDVLRCMSGLRVRFGRAAGDDGRRRGMRRVVRSGMLLGPASSDHAAVGEGGGARRCRDRRLAVIDGRAEIAVATGLVVMPPLHLGRADMMLLRESLLLRRRARPLRFLDTPTAPGDDRPVL